MTKKAAKKAAKKTAKKRSRVEYTKADVRELRAHSKAKTPVNSIFTVGGGSLGDSRSVLRNGVSVSDNRASKTVNRDFLKMQQRPLVVCSLDQSCFELIEPHQTGSR